MHCTVHTTRTGWPIGGIQKHMDRDCFMTTKEAEEFEIIDVVIDHRHRSHW